MGRMKELYMDLREKELREFEIGYEIKELENERTNLSYERALLSGEFRVPNKKHGSMPENSTPETERVIDSLRSALLSGNPEAVRLVNEWHSIELERVLDRWHKEREDGRQ